VRRRWIALFAAGATAIALAAMVVSAAAGPGSTATYDISLTGSQRSVVTRNGTTTDDLGCTVRHADRDVQTIAFASRRRAPLAISSRGLPTIRFDLAARVSGSFHRESSSNGPGSDCVSAPTKSDTSCGPARLRARLVLRPKPNRGLRLDGGFVRPRDRTRCATTLTAPDAFLLPIESRLKRSPAGAARIFVNAHIVSHSSAAHGVTKTTTVDLKLVLTRVT
jgi:hypothetical protein